MPRTNTDYSKTVIYKIVCNDTSIPDTYIGSTTKFTNRKNQHKTACITPNNKMYNEKKYRIIRENGGWGNWDMIEVEKYPCNDGNEARARERYWYDRQNSSLNERRPFSDEAEKLERQKIYSKENKEKIKEIKRLHREKNIESIKATQNQYRINNKEKITECERLYREKNIDSIKARQKQYRIDNLDKKRECAKIYRENNADKIKRKVECECGSTIIWYNRGSHYDTIRHKKYVDTTTTNSLKN